MSDPRHDWASSRLVSAAQYLRNPDTGAELLVLEDLLTALRSRKLIDRWAVIVHERSHVHLVAACDKKGIPRASWAKWLGIPAEKIWRITGGESGLGDCLDYMLHNGEAGEGKVPYEPEDVIASPGWDWEALVRERRAQLAVQHGVRRSRAKLPVSGQILTQGVSVAEARGQTGMALSKLQEWRGEYLMKQPPPRTRINLYVHVPASPAREPLVRALTEVVSAGDGVFEAPTVEWVWSESEWVPEGGGDPRWSWRPGDQPGLHSNVGFWTRRGGNENKYDLKPVWRSYDGQRTLLWDAVLATSHTGGESGATVYGMANGLGGVWELFQALAPTPSQNAKVEIWTGEDSTGQRTHTQLVHTTSVIVSSDPFAQFHADLERLYEEEFELKDPGTTARLQFPIIVPVDATSFGIELLGRYIDDSHDVGAYREIARVRSSLQEIAERAAAVVDPAARTAVTRELHARQFARLVDRAERVRGALRPEQSPDDVLGWAQEIGVGELIEPSHEGEDE